MPSYGRRLPIVIALCILSDGHFSRATEPAFEKGEGPSTKNTFDSLANAFLPKSSMYGEIGENSVAEGPFPSVNLPVHANISNLIPTEC